MIDDQDLKVVGRGQRSIKWLVLVLSGLALIGGIMAYDSVGALGVFLQMEKGITATQLGILYSAYGLPNLALAPFSGAIVDRIGCYTSMVIFSFVASLGTILVALGTFRNNLFGLMVAGRVLTGAGVESLSLAVRKNTTLWFPEGQNRSMALSFIVTFPWLGTIGAFIGLPMLADQTEASTGLWLAAGLTCLGLVIFSSLLAFDKLGWLKIVDGDNEGSSSDTSRWVHFSDVKTFPTSYWLSALYGLFLCGSVWPFLALAPDFFHTKFGYSPKYSGLLGAGFCAVSIIFSPIFGELIDRYPIRLEMGMLSGIFGAGSFMLLGYSDFSPILGACVLGLVLAAVTPVCYPIISLVIPPTTLATALGIAKSIENLGYVIMPYLFGALFDETGSFLVGCSLFAATSLWGTGCCVLLKLFYPPVPYADSTYEVLADDTETAKNSCEDEEEEEEEGVVVVVDRGASKNGDGDDDGEKAHLLKGPSQ